MKVQILVDTLTSWAVPYAELLRDELLAAGQDARLIHRHKDVEEGDVLCLLSCERRFTGLHLNKYNLVIHASDLPKGKGWSPITWQVLEGKNRIPLTLFEAADAIDAGDIYLQYYMELDGTELLPEIKHQQGLITNKLVVDFLANIDSIQARKQEGEESFYPRRSGADAELNPEKSIAEQFDLLRVCDNDRYPAFFHYRGTKYILKIEKAEDPQ